MVRLCSVDINTSSYREMCLYGTSNYTLNTETGFATALEVAKAPVGDVGPDLLKGRGEAVAWLGQISFRPNDEDSQISIICKLHNVPEVVVDASVHGIRRPGHIDQYENDIYVSVVGGISEAIQRV